MVKSTRVGLILGTIIDPYTDLKARGGLPDS